MSCRIIWGLLCGTSLALIVGLFDLYRPLSFHTPPHMIVVRPQQSLSRVAQTLHDAHLVTHPRLMTWTGRLMGISRHLHTGEYLIQPHDSLASILSDLSHGRTYQRAWTLVPGWRLAQIRASLNKAPYLTHTTRGLSDQALAQQIGIKTTTPEGWFLPETYFYSRGDTDLSVLKNAYQAMQAAVSEAWRDRDPSIWYHTPYEALIAASLIEKETACEPEKPLIAAVMTRRLKHRMRLQIDPTVIYAMGKQYTGHLHRGDLHYRSRYNTYLHRGLPPTPIAAPGLSTLHAAMHPSRQGYVFYVAKGDGCHVFSKTIGAHRAAYRHYIKGES